MAPAVFIEKLLNAQYSLGFTSKSPSLALNFGCENPRTSFMVILLSLLVVGSTIYA
jgi:hypothetical protein